MVEVVIYKANLSASKDIRGYLYPYTWAILESADRYECLLPLSGFGRTAKRLADLGIVYQVQLLEEGSA